MDIVVAALVIGVLVGVAIYLRSRRAGQPERSAGTRLPVPGRAESGGPLRAAVTLETVRPGDALVFWDGRDALVEAVLDCQEQVGNRTVSWQWILLDNGWVIERSADGRFLYTESMLFRQGTWEFDHLTGEVEHDGVLKTFEERVREGTSSREPVYFAFGDALYQVLSTGTFAAVPRGGTPPARPVWGDISPDAYDNVYFGMSASDEDHALGIWTTHIVFLQGRVLHDADLRGVYGA
ncbi:MAG: hypothetical protein HY689_13555 [Chloroflexi bacterium]|nr:hypothetical protein [Chloroflexota bacterium]